MSTFFTWRDVQSAFERHASKPWLQVVSDPTGVRIVCSPNNATLCWDAIPKVVSTFDIDQRRIRLESLPSMPRYLEVEVIVDQDENLIRSIERPLWSSKSITIAPSRVGGASICAFYSYKGGVGRTTTVLGVLGEMLSASSASRVLVIDADFEAPGLSWMLRPPQDQTHFSLLDALSLVHDSDDWRDEALPLIADRVRLSSSYVELPEGRREFWFLPAIRNVDQLFVLPVKPEQMVRSRGRAWIVGDLLDALASELKFDAVLVDMRTGVTEFSSPLLLDARIEKVLVTSCNAQSVNGTIETLRKVKQLHPEDRSPDVVVSFVPQNSGDLYERVVADLLDVLAIDDDDSVASANSQIEIHKFDFAQELLHFDCLDEFYQKCVPGTSLAKRVAPSLVERLIKSSNVNGVGDDVAFGSHAPIPPHRVAEMAQKLEFAENNAEIGLLPTPALKKLLEVPTGRLPVSVVLGSKGAGKTFVWGQLVLSQNLDRFAGLAKVSLRGGNASIFPLLSPSSMGESLAEKVSDAESKVIGVNSARLSRVELRQSLENVEASGVNDALEFWIVAISARLGLPEPEGKSPAEKIRRVFDNAPPTVLVVDGLEDAFQVSATRGLTAIQAKLLRGLLQELPNLIRDSGMLNVGMVVFVRRDLASAAIHQNFGQFEALYRDTTLSWTSADALRLPIWLLNRLGWTLDVKDPDSASYEVLSKALVPFWGEKMGGKREAFTSDWVIATLSDFNLVLQARDMIRLLRYAAEGHSMRDFPIAHTALRQAIPQVSRCKIDELGKEVPALEQIFDRLKSCPLSDRVVPLSPDDVGLKQDEVAFMQQLGLLAHGNDSDRLFMPEIVRHGLGYKLANRGRARVLALYKEAKQRRQAY